MALRLGFIGIVTRDMSASLAFYRLLGAPVPDGSDESHVDTRLEDGTVLEGYSGCVLGHFRGAI